MFLSAHFALGSFIGPIGVTIYSCLAIFFSYRLRKLEGLLRHLRYIGRRAEKSFIESWAFRPGKRTLGHLATEYPFLMPTLGTLGGISAWFIVLGILHYDVPFFGLWIGALYFVFPLYYAADGFEAWLMSRASAKADLKTLSKQDQDWLLEAQGELKRGFLYFTSLAALFLCVMLLLFFYGAELDALQPRWVGGTVSDLVSLTLFALATMAATIVAYHFQLEELTWPRGDQIPHSPKPKSPSFE